MTTPITRVFLHENQGALDATTHWLLANRLEDLGSLAIVLPGRRAARALEERLVRQAPAGALIPALHTLGSLTDAMVQLSLPTATPLVRTLAWTRALQELPAETLLPLSPKLPNKDDLSGWMSLAQWLKRLHGELGAECQDFQSVLHSGHLPSAEETERWKALAACQQAYRQQLEDLRVVDPHDARLDAVQKGQVSFEAPVLLVGVAEINGLQKEILRGANASCTALVFSPENQAHRFDEWGCLDISAWTSAEARISFQSSQWFIADKPVHQADATMTAMAKWKGEYSPEEITVGVLDEDVTPYLQRRLLNHGISSHAAQGLLAGRTQPFRLLEALAQWTDGYRFRDLAALLRHPDLVKFLKAEDAPEKLDVFHSEHLPDRADGALPGKDSEREAIQKWVHSIAEIFATGARGKRRPAQKWVSPLLAGLTKIYSGREWNPHVPRDHQLIESFKLLRRGLQTLEELPTSLADTLPLTFAQAIRLLLKEVASEAIPELAKERAIEFVGWLELRFDPAKAMVITGFNEGKVPESIHADPFLPDGLRKNLGLPDNQSRLARDSFTLAALLEEKEKVILISGRRSADNDPLLPSRLLFLDEPAVGAERMRHFLNHQVNFSLKDPASFSAKQALPERADWELPKTIRVTDFARFLYSPYAFYLERVLGLKTMEDTDQEMGALLFGSLTHNVLEVFGESDLKDSTDAKKIFYFLKKELRRRMDFRFGESPLPAVYLQETQLLHRLQRFADLQAEHRESGWEIHAVEWKPEGGSLAVTFEDQTFRLSGRIDRVDKRVAADGTVQYLLLDFKSGDAAKLPKKVFGSRSKKWSDLQLPLYRLMGKKCGFGDAKLGYWNLPKNPDDAGLAWADQAWEDTWQTEDGNTENAFSIAEKTAAEIYRSMLAGEFFENGDVPRNPILASIAGVGLLETDEEDGEEL
jgi:ATP-dependent helicase/nuclease subunit B